MYEVLRKGRMHNLSIKCQLNLFDKIVKPILLYGCEIWGLGKNDIIERVHLKFCKLLLRLKVSTTNFKVYGELGRYPLEIVSFRKFFSDNTRIRIFFFLSREARIFFPEFNIRLYDKNSESNYFFFLHQNQNIFFSNIGNQNIFLEKNHYPPFKLNSLSLTV
jgi:hypothetical protein